LSMMTVQPVSPRVYRRRRSMYASVIDPSAKSS
jgi:hypothetical protein